jgi:hypothetical protein
MSAGQHKQIDIWRGARSFQLRSGFIKQYETFEKSLEIPWHYLANFFVRQPL